MRQRKVALALSAPIGAGALVFALFLVDGRTGAIFAGLVPRLFLIVLTLTTLGFVGVEAALVWTRFRAGRRDNRAARNWDGWGVEAVWSIVPAAILASIALYLSAAPASIGLRPAAPRVPAPAERNYESWPTTQSPGQPATDGRREDPQ